MYTTTSQGTVVTIKYTVEVSSVGEQTWVRVVTQPLSSLILLRTGPAWTQVSPSRYDPCERVPFAPARRRWPQPVRLYPVATVTGASCFRPPLQHRRLADFEQVAAISLGSVGVSDIPSSIAARRDPPGTELASNASGRPGHLARRVQAAAEYHCAAEGDGSV